MEKCDFFFAGQETILSTLSLDPQTVETFSSFGRQVVGFLQVHGTSILLSLSTSEVTGLSFHASLSTA